VGGDLDGLPDLHASSFRVGFAWPETDNSGNDLYATTTSPDWGIEANASYDGLTFADGLPYDFAFDHSDNTLYVESSPLVGTNTYNLESGEFSNYEDVSDFGQDGRLNVPGTEGGRCRGVFCKAGRELREDVEIISEEDDDGNEQFYVSDLNSPWPNLGGENYVVTIVQGSSTVNVSTSGGQTLTVGDATSYVLPIATGALPGGLNLGPVKVYYNIVYIARMNKRLEPEVILVSDIAPGNVPFIRAFIQGRQGASLGGVWIGQKTPNGIDVKPFTPHRSTVAINDTGNTETNGDGGPVKVIKTFTHIDKQGVSTAPTESLDPLDTYKSINESPKKCGSFLSPGGVNSAGIFTPSDYPIRWLTSNQGTPLATYYVSANTPTSIDLNTVFNVSAESIVNEDDGNLATFFIARSLNNHDETENEIYISLNYSEQ
jgi:hypothetical protein